MKKSCSLNALSCCVLVLFTNITNATVLPFESRLGGLAYYDPNLDITWATDANLTSFDTWDNQTAWVADLTIGGVSGWRLPSADVNGDDIVVDCYGGGVTDCNDNELGYLFWEEGITEYQPGVFINIQRTYWTGTELSDTFGAWYFTFYGLPGSGVLLPNL